MLLLLGFLLGPALGASGKPLSEFTTTLPYQEDLPAVIPSGLMALKYAF
jgi:hypothetical protein